MQDKADLFTDMAERILSNVEGVNFAGVFWHETNVQFLHEYEGGQDADATRGADPTEGQADREAWQGRTVREGVAAADQQRRAGQSGDAVSSQLEEDLTLQQAAGVPPRGDINVNDLNNIRIRLFETEDLSTFLHESGHLYLEMLAELSTIEGADPSLAKDFSNVLDWLGVSSREEITAEHHDKWAQSYEEYLREGKAPSVELANAFSKFTAWLTTLYRRLRSAGQLPQAALNPEIADIFDRLLASEEQIEEAQQVSSMLPVFKEAATGEMTEKEYDAYQSDLQRASEASNT